jgi:MFS family permease
MKIAINKVVKIMVFSDLFLNAGWGLVSPIFAIYIVGNIESGSAKVVGIAVGVYWLGKSFFQIPIAHYLDKNHGEKDDFGALIFGTFLVSFIPIGFIFATLPWHLYLLQIFHALGMAFALPSWWAIFTRHIQKEREAFCWSLDSSIIGLGAGLAGILGGIIADRFGFVPIFILVSILGIVATIVLLFMRKDILPKTSTQGIYPVPKS